MTYDQKFILLLKTDAFFKKECRYMVEEWGLPKTKEIATATESELPIQYKKDIRFILLQAKLPLRYFLPLHRYLLTGVMPKMKNLPKRTRVFVSLDPTTEMGRVHIEVDLDAGKKEILDTLKDVSEMKALIQKINQVGTKSQPIRNFDETLKIALNSTNITEMSDVAGDWSEDMAIVRKKNLAARSRLRTKLSRGKKALTGGRRISVRRREEVERTFGQYDQEAGW